MNKWMKTYWRQRGIANFADSRVFEIEYAKKIGDEKTMIKIHPSLIEYIKNPSEEIQLMAVQKSGFLIKHIIRKGIEPSEEVKLAAVKQHGFSIEYIENPSEQVQFVAVKDNPDAILDIIRKGIQPSGQVQLAAIKHNPYYFKYATDYEYIINTRPDLIMYIQNPSEELQMIAVQKIPYTIRDIETPTERVKQLARSKGVKI